MQNPKRILVVCGTGIATATIVAEKIKNALNTRGIPVVTCTCQADDTAQKTEEFRPDCVVSTTFMEDRFSVPVFRGLPFLTGVKEEKALSELADYLSRSSDPSAAQ